MIQSFNDSIPKRFYSSNPRLGRCIWVSTTLRRYITDFVGDKEMGACEGNRLLPLGSCLLAYFHPAEQPATTIPLAARSTTFVALSLSGQWLKLELSGCLVSPWSEVMKRVGTWMRPSQCESFWSWVHKTWSKNRWEGHDCLVFELWSRWFGFEFIEQGSVED